jgi:hypothetical protein
VDALRDQQETKRNSEKERIHPCVKYNSTAFKKQVGLPPLPVREKTPVPFAPTPPKGNLYAASWHASFVTYNAHDLRPPTSACSLCNGDSSTKGEAFSFRPIKWGRLYAAVVMIEFHLDDRSGVPPYLQIVQQVKIGGIPCFVAAIVGWILHKSAEKSLTESASLL